MTGTYTWVNPCRGLTVGPIGGEAMLERELNLRDPGDRDLLIVEWIKLAESADQERFWAYETLADLIHEEPTLAWTIILELVHRAPPGPAFGLASAGPLEDLIAFLGQEVIDLIEQQVQGDEGLGMALSGVWLSERDNLAPKRSSLCAVGRSSKGEL